MLGRMLRTHLAADPAFSVEWTSRRENSGAHLFEADSSSSQALAGIIQRGGGYDYVVNCIALLKNAAAEAGDPSAMAPASRINAEFPHTLASLAEESRFRLLHVSTDAGGVSVTVSVGRFAAVVFSCVPKVFVVCDALSLPSRSQPKFDDGEFNID